MTINLKTNLSNPIFIISSLIILSVSYIRVTRGFDLTDEMQYYGEIKGLIDSGKLFSNDLFIQQVVYILFYPIFYLYHLIFDYQGFVFFGRLLMMIISLGVFMYAYGKLLDLKCSSTVASLTALSLTFAIPYHGVFAPSYNTVSQAIWIIFALRYFEWRFNSAISLAILPIAVAFAHPTSAVTMALLIFLRLLIERNFKLVLRLLLVFVVCAFILTPVIFYFSSLPEYLNAISFSSGYGVGSAFFSNTKQPVKLILVFAMFVGALIIGRRFDKIGFIFPFVFLLAVSIVLFKADLFSWGYSPRAIRAFSFLGALAFCWSLSNFSDVDVKFKQRISWLAVAILAYATTLGVTSSNGIGQATGAFMIGLPLFLAIAVNNKPNPNFFDRFLFVNVACVMLVATLFVAHWIHYPYREDSFWKTNVPVQSVPEFKFINTSLERVVFIKQMQQALGPFVKGKRTLIVSEYPALYFLLDAEQETCMLYMHSLTSEKSKNALLSCLANKKPMVVVDVLSDEIKGNEKSQIKTVMYDFYNNLGLSCAVKDVDFEKISKYNPHYLKYIICN